mgnify:CR=1 FL=1
MYNENIQMLEALHEQLWAYYMNNAEPLLDNIVCWDPDAPNGVGGAGITRIRESESPQANMEGLVMHLTRMLKRAVRQIHTDLALFKGIAEMSKENERSLVGLADKSGELLHLIGGNRPEAMSPDELDQWNFKTALKEGANFTLVRDRDHA